MPSAWKLPIYYQYYSYKKVLEPELEMLQHIVPRDRTAVDVGANLGLYAYRLAELCPRIEAFEPNPACAAILRGYKHPKIHVHTMALSSQQGTAQLTIPSVDGRELPGLASLGHVGEAGSGRTLSVPLETLDSRRIANVGFIKIDVEGHESEVLAGARQTLEHHRPVLLVEIEQRHLHRPIEEVFDLIRYQGYAGYYLLMGKLRPLATYVVARHQSVPYGSPEHVNNFFFVPTEDTQRVAKLRAAGLLDV